MLNSKNKSVEETQIRLITKVPTWLDYFGRKQPAARHPSIQFPFYVLKIHAISTM